MTARGKLVARLTGAVATAFLASLALTWVLHDRMTSRDAHKLIDVAFKDVEGAIREKVDRRLVRQAMLFRDKLPELRKDPGWGDRNKSVALLQRVANELKVDELCVVNSRGLLTHSADERDIGFDFTNITGQAAGFRPLLDRETEITQPLLPNTRAGDMIKYVGVWLPEGGFVQVGCRERSLRYLARSAITGLTHNRHVSGEEGYIVITTASGTIISHPDAKRESGQWREPGDECYWQRRVVEGFSVYVVIPKRTAIVERRVLVGMSSLMNGITLVLAAMLVGLVIASYVRAQVRAQRAKEMKMAADIQESAIPRVFPPFPGEKRVNIYASMDTAKEVGGDFYDFYFSGPQKITFLIADVSDKGVPAALFMMRAKTIIKNIAQTGKPIAEVVTEANDVLCEGNGANMFVTAWIGEIDLESGRVAYVNAGHNPPILLQADDHDTYLRTRPGLVLGAMPGVKYHSQEVVIAPGDALYLYTDGVTEQTNAQGELFGENRLLSFLSFGRFYEDPGAILPAVSARVSAFAANTAQADDRTQLVIRYRGTA
ncbi:MAG: SpoIIE family protein phosphatase [Kiritimatiellae bacterium]|nr:SpoIIE family protein phosphatase [Kiritimatiellia bacterium]